jgi:hypothetical protein
MSIFNRFPASLVLLACLTTSCGEDDAKEGDTSAGDDLGHEGGDEGGDDGGDDGGEGSGDDGGDDTSGETGADPITVTEGRWSIDGGAWKNDDCNGGDWLETPTALDISAVQSENFMMAVLFSGYNAGEVMCTHAGDNVYDCTALTMEWDQSPSASISLAGTFHLTFADESSISGPCDLELDCTGDGCGSWAEFPCTSTYSWYGSI